MARFVTRKKVVVKRYEIIIAIIIFISIFILIVNYLVDIFLNKNKTSFFLNNTLGVINSRPLKNYFYKNIIGIDITLPEEEITTDNLVYIYNTYQTDSYKSNKINTYNIDSYVTQGSFILKEYLKSFGINSLVETKSVGSLQNEYEYSAYEASRELLKNSQKENKKLKYFFDIGINSKKYDDTTVTINDKKYAKVEFILGNKNPNIKSSLDIANKINNKLKDLNVDISLGISYSDDVDGIYNEDLGAMLILVGGSDNTIGEVNRTMKILAKAISLYIKEDYNAKEK